LSRSRTHSRSRRWATRFPRREYVPTPIVNPFFSPRAPLPLPPPCFGLRKRVPGYPFSARPFKSSPVCSRRFFAPRVRLISPSHALGRSLLFFPFFLSSVWAPFFPSIIHAGFGSFFLNDLGGSGEYPREECSGLRGGQAGLVFSLLPFLFWVACDFREGDGGRESR